MTIRCVHSHTIFVSSLFNSRAFRQLASSTSYPSCTHCKVVSCGLTARSFHPLSRSRICPSQQLVEQMSAPTGISMLRLPLRMLWFRSRGAMSRNVFLHRRERECINKIGSSFFRLVWRRRNAATHFNQNYENNRCCLNTALDNPHDSSNVFPFFARIYTEKDR